MKKIALLLLLLSADLAFGQATYYPVSVAFPQIAIGGDNGGDHYVTLLQLVNNNSAGTTGHLALYSDSGSALSALFDGQGPQSALDVTLAPGEARQIQLTLDGPITPGWLAIDYSPSDALTTVILQYRSGETLRSEVGVQPSFSTVESADVAVETDDATSGSLINVGIAIANPGSTTANVFVGLWDPNTGGLLTSATIALPPKGHVSRFLGELFPNVLAIAHMRAKLNLDSCSSPSCAFIGGNGFVATVLRLNGDQFTTVPVAERTDTGDQIRVLPQVAFGGPSNALNMKTVLYFTTNVPTGVFGTADIFDDD